MGEKCPVWGKGGREMGRIKGGICYTSIEMFIQVSGGLTCNFGKRQLLPRSYLTEGKLYFLCDRGMHLYYGIFAVRATDVSYSWVQAQTLLLAFSVAPNQSNYHSSAEFLGMKFTQLCLVLPCSWSLSSCRTTWVLNGVCWKINVFMLSGLFSSPCVSLCSLHCIGQSQRVRRSSSAVPHAVLTSYTVLNNLVSSLEMRGVVPTWETTWPSVITMRTSQHKKPESIRVELAIRAQAGITEVDSKPSSENARPRAGPYMTSQRNRGLLLFSDPQERCRKCFVMHHHPLASRTSLSSSLSAYPQKQDHHIVQSERTPFEWLLNDLG